MTVGERDWLAEQFKKKRDHLGTVAYRMLGSLSEADDAVQKASAPVVARYPKVIVEPPAKFGLAEPPCSGTNWVRSGTRL